MHVKKINVDVYTVKDDHASYTCTWIYITCIYNSTKSYLVPFPPLRAAPFSPVFPLVPQLYTPCLSRTVETLRR